MWRGRQGRSRGSSELWTDEDVWRHLRHGLPIGFVLPDYQAVVFFIFVDYAVALLVDGVRWGVVDLGFH